MYSSAYNRIFWGYLLVLLDLRIQTLDIIPDFIGFMMIFVALGTLAAQHEDYGQARPFALILIFFSLVELFQLPQTNLLQTPLSAQNTVLLMIGQVAAIVQLFMVYRICRAVAALAAVQGLPDLEGKAKARWRFFFGITAVILAATPFMLNLTDEWKILFLVLVILGFAANLLIMLLVRGAGRQIGDTGYHI